MTFIVKTAATLRLADGSTFDLVAGMHDDFPAPVKKHWAFASYAEPVDTSKQDTADRKGAAAAKKQITELQVKLLDAQEKLKTITDLLNVKEVTVSEQLDEITTLKARITELEGLAADADELRARITITEPEKPVADTNDGSQDHTGQPERGKKNAKKQSASDS
jgi:hypothetical protein